MFYMQLKMSGGAAGVTAVKQKFKVLQNQADEAKDRAERLQRELEKERNAREEVCMTLYTCTGGGGGSALL